KLIGKAKARSFTSSEYPGEEKFEDSCSNCRERFVYYEKIKRENELFHNYSPSYGWISESLRVKSLINRGKPENIETPVLIFSAENDTVVEKKPQEKLEEKIRECRMEIIPGAKHEIYLSDDKTVENYIGEILKFYLSN
ncbi:MAG: alpha/beta hydrolase, partial [Clostridia bacterium]|nr:alpha/beta hydrolase [Clostridia bacterium]